MGTSTQGDTMKLHTYTSNQYPYQVPTSYTVRFLRYSLDKVFRATHLPTQTPWVKTIPAQPLQAVG